MMFKHMTSYFFSSFYKMCIIQQSLASIAFLFNLNLVVKISFLKKKKNLNPFENLIESFLFL